MLDQAPRRPSTASAAKRGHQGCVPDRLLPGHEWVILLLGVINKVLRREATKIFGSYQKSAAGPVRPPGV